jgi:undecaprenyl diphosphate synthase
MDGNGRWATARGLPRFVGHCAGARTARRVVDAALEHEIGVLTLYAFSADNWARPPREVRSILRLIQVYVQAQIPRCLDRGVRMRLIGRRDRLPPGLAAAIGEAETATAGGARLLLRLAVDYSARETILRAAARLDPLVEWNLSVFASAVGEACHGGAPSPDVDLLIRTGGERRLSDFLLWEAAYAELHFTSRTWPEFSAEDFAEALQDFRSRVRRFGRLPEAVVGVGA